MHPYSGHIERFAEFEAPDDEAALALAREHVGDNPLELWCERRKVSRIDAISTIGGRSGDVKMRHVPI